MGTDAGDDDALSRAVGEFVERLRTRGRAVARGEGPRPRQRGPRVARGGPPARGRLRLRRRPPRRPRAPRVPALVRRARARDLERTVGWLAPDRRAHSRRPRSSTSAHRSSTNSSSTTASRAPRTRGPTTKPRSDRPRHLRAQPRCRTDGASTSSTRTAHVARAPPRAGDRASAPTARTRRRPIPRRSAASPARRRGTAPTLDALLDELDAAGRPGRESKRKCTSSSASRA